MSDLRIKSLDGLRAIAALGVIWIHSWVYNGNPSAKIGGLDFFRFIAILGNGVDLFFVISGFCMFLVLHSKQFNWGNYKDFLIRRFRRIAPVYYASIIVYGLILYFNTVNYNLIKNIILNGLFLGNFFQMGNIIGPYWSLGTEWCFYMILPVLFLNYPKHFNKNILILSIASFICSILTNYQFISAEFWAPQITNRFFEFGFGILAARLYISGNSMTPKFSGTKGLLLFGALAYLGRILITEQIKIQFGTIGSLLNTIGLPLMTLGFSGILFLVVREDNWLARLLSKRGFLYLGRISYSLYIWHTLAFILLEYFLPDFKGGVVRTLVIFVIITLITILISDISYRTLEKPYFKKTIDQN